MVVERRNEANNHNIILGKKRSVDDVYVRISILLDNGDNDKIFGVEDLPTKNLPIKIKDIHCSEIDSLGPETLQ